MILLSTPLVLQVHLKRFAFDPWTFQRRKLNSVFTFPFKLDLSNYCENTQEGHQYSLFAVLVHSGGSSGGHYYAFINTPDGWVKFDDDRITFSSVESVVECSFGKSVKSSTSAYMLIYVKSTAEEDVRKVFSKKDEVSQFVEDQLKLARSIRDSQIQKELEAFLTVQIHVLTYDALALDLDVFSKGIFTLAKLQCNFFSLKKNIYIYLSFSCLIYLIFSTISL